MKIAAVTEDGTTISQHFGRAPYYLVVTVEDGQIVNKEKEDKVGHHSFAGIPEEHIPGQEHGYGTGSQENMPGWHRLLPIARSFSLAGWLGRL